ncbi:hypothetical protein MKX01_010836 [Papaver californicum]|nr:hypothetical protein MKX01_010836 [Papaver californicum]
MVKVQMNTADVAAEVKCLRKLIGMRCSNVYDLTPKTYMFKLMHSSGNTESGESEKVLLLMESGVRLHTTEYIRDKSTTPSGFTLKLRKHIRTRRLEDVRQLGYDRIVLFQFGLGANAHYVILELYAQGNITLRILNLDDDKGLAIMSRHPYPVEACRLFTRTTATKLQDVLTSFNQADNKDGCNDASDTSTEKHVSRKNIKPSDANKDANDGGRPKQASLKVVLGEVLGYGPALSEHIILDVGLIPNTKVGNDCGVDDNTIWLLIEAVAKFEDWLEDIISGEKVPEGYILMQKGKKEILPSEEGTSSKVYDEFCPILLNQLKSRESMKFETFDAALDEFYSKIESQRSEQQQKTKEGSAVQKLNKIRLDQENRVHALKKEVDRCITMAELIEYNLEDVDSAILAVRVALANGMNWDDLARMIEVDLALSAHANARRWYEQKKKQESKQEKTVTAHEKAFKAAERKTRLQLSQEKTVAAISHMRKVHWFEKFNWFISSENYLVISGRDAQQNEIIVKRYMSKGDLYVHAELHGASNTVIKNHKPENPVPPLQLNQAGCFTVIRSVEKSTSAFSYIVCHSAAWDSKIVASAWVRGEEEELLETEELESFKEIPDSEMENEVVGVNNLPNAADDAKPKLGGLSVVGSASESDSFSTSNKHEGLIEDKSLPSISPQLEDLIDRGLSGLEMLM